MSQNSASPVSTTRFSEYIYNLVTFELDVYETVESSQHLCLNLSVTFTTSEVTIKRFFRPSVSIIFGIKRGNLNLKFKNGKMNLRKRKPFDNERDNWRVIDKGLPEAPGWEFTLLNHSKGVMLTQPSPLQGEIKNQFIGYIELLKPGEFFELEATFEISINRNHIVVIETDGVPGNRKQKETKTSAVLKYLKNQNKLEKYLSKVVVNI